MEPIGINVASDDGKQQLSPTVGVGAAPSNKDVGPLHKDKVILSRVSIKKSKTTAHKFSDRFPNLARGIENCE